MNVLFLSELFYPHGGGAELATYLFAKSLEAAGLNAVIITNRFPQEDETTKDGNLTICRVPMFETENSKYSLWGRVDLLFSRFLRKWVKWADVVYIPRFWFSAIPLAKAYRKPVVVHLHDYIPICPLSTAYNVFKNAKCDCRYPHCSLRCIYAFEKTAGANIARASSSVLLNSTFGNCLSRLLELSDALICASEAQRDIIVQKRPSLSQKIRVIHNPLPRLRQVDIRGNDFGYFGGPYLLKGFHVLYRAVLQLRYRMHHEVNLHVSDFSKASVEFSERMRRSGFTLYGRLSGLTYEEVYGQVRSVVVPSICLEVSSYVAVEALLRERLLLASHIGGIPEIVEGCPGAFMVSPGDGNMLAEMMSYVWNLSSEVAVDLGAKNKENLVKRDSGRESIGNFVRVLTSVNN